MNFIKRAFGEFNKFHIKLPQKQDSFHHMTFRKGYHSLQGGHIFHEYLHCCYGRRHIRMSYIPAKVLILVWS